MLLDKAVKEIRRISENLRPSELDTLGLAAAVRGLSDDFRERTGMKVQLQVSRFPKRLNAEMELTLFRIVQEALNNVEKHSRASEVILELAREDTFVKLRVRDDGKGFDSASQPNRTGPKNGMGLAGMKERVSFVGGSFSVKSAPNAGTEIDVRVPLRSNSDGL